jgi:hypothetical protein
MRQVQCGRIGKQQGSLAEELRREISRSTVGEPCTLRALACHPISGQLEEAQ